MHGPTTTKRYRGVAWRAAMTNDATGNGRDHAYKYECGARIVISNLLYLSGARPTRADLHGLFGSFVRSNLH